MVAVDRARCTTSSHNLSHQWRNKPDPADFSGLRRTTGQDLGPRHTDRRVSQSLEPDRISMCEDAFAMRPASIPGATGSLLVSATTVLYLVVINSQGNVDTRRVTVWVITLATCAALGTVASWSRQPKVRSIILATTGGALVGLGWLGIFSIGLLLVASGVLFVIAAVKAAAEDRSGSGALPTCLGCDRVRWSPDSASLDCLAHVGLHESRDVRPTSLGPVRE